MTARRAAALRRYPALGYLAATGALALLLPSGLTVPNSGPPTLAEYAPVPGQGEGRSDAGELAAPISDGIGAGGAGTAPGAGPVDAPASVAGPDGQLIRKPGTKRCVGSPPRQTEDPLSPPCIAYFEGNNGGATAKGVTADEVTVIVQTEKTETDPDKRAVVDCADPVSPDDAFQDVVCKAYMRFFNERYQTYGRRVHLYSSHDALIDDLDETYRPFAYVNFDSPYEAAAKRGILAPGYPGRGRAEYRALAPFLSTFRPDREDQAAMAASFLCSKLAGRPARYAGDPLLRQSTRKFGYWFSGSGSAAHYERAVIAAVKDRCGISIEDTASGAGDGIAATRLKNAGVTTVLVSAPNASVAAMTAQASNAGWLPEWFVPGSPDPNGIDVNFSARLARPEQWANAFGLSVDYRRGRVGDQTWFRAYREGCPDCPEPTVGGRGVRAAAAAYDSLSLFFYGLQAAGPRLTPQNVDRGLHAIPPRRSTNPYAPAAYFSPGNYSFLKDAMAIRWDGAGSPPGSAQRGCYRLPHDGLRFRAGEWPPGDDDLALSTTRPCQGDTFEG
jgi:hypothetical protein